MGDVIGMAVLLGVPIGVFIWRQWTREERERNREREERPPDRPAKGSKDSYWGGMGRPGRGH